MHIISPTETKLKESSTHALTNSLYHFYVSNFIPTNPSQWEASLKTAIMVCNSLQPYIYNIQTWSGTAICIDLFLPCKNCIQIILVYFPSNHLELNKSIQKRVLKWYLEAKNKNWNALLMGDFNTNQSRNKKFPLFTNLNIANATSLLDFRNIPTPT